MQLVYIAGPISGDIERNKQAFFHAAERLSRDGMVVLHSAALPPGLSEPQYMDICYAMIRACTHMVMLPGWRNSDGAIAEYYYAKKLGLCIDYWMADVAASKEAANHS
jgi:hypothetical protein